MIRTLVKFSIVKYEILESFYNYVLGLSSASSALKCVCTTLFIFHTMIKLDPFDFNMSNCSQQRKGNIFSSSLPDKGPYTGSVERVCQDDSGNANSYSRQYSSYVSNARPENPQAIAQALESRTPSSGGIFGNLGNVFKSVLGGPRQNIPNASHPSNTNAPNPNAPNPNASHPSAATFNIKEQDWPTPELEDDSHDDGDEGGTHRSSSSGGTRLRRPPQKKRSRSVKKRRSRSIKKSAPPRKRSSKKTSKPRKR